MAKKKNVIAAHEQVWCVELKAATEKALEVVIFDDIGESFFADGVTAKDVLNAVRSAPDAKDIKLRVNSRGGIVDQAKGMVNILRERQAAGATITAYVDGIAASAASYLLTVADKVVMPSNTFQMVHGARGGARGTAEDFDAYAALLRKTNEQIAEDYAKASQRRGKGKTKEDFLAVFKGQDMYLDADEAIEWGLADEKLEELKVAATTVDLGELEELAPEALKAALYVSNQKNVPEPKAKPAPPTNQLTLPAIEARETSTQKENHSMKNIIMALGLPEDADEAAIVVATNNLKASARVGAEVEKLVGALGDTAIGAVRALKDGQAKQAEMASDLEKVRITLARKDFDTLIEAARANGQIAPHGIKEYTTEFEVAAAQGGSAAESVVASVRGYVAKAPRVKALSRVKVPTEQVDVEGPMQFQGKTFAQMRHIDRSRLKDSDPDLYAMMRADWEEAGKPAA